ncbi:DegV family protein [Bacillus solimangrovi]|uniref:Fatty acid-binding protein DegV n=1 Tax=Bacillus solimangrovi TaxID=1305675 RepID=A0A1E5LC36_9BACI|nr:DegV family protein [Bacillus solimangrovi]OEH91654.1 fatty acid-binding protein DegV [Bacillus solimangrovi]
MSIRIITDSGCDLSNEILEQLNITCVPFGVHIDGVDYLDRETIEIQTVYEELEKGKIAKTSQVSPAILEETFTNVAKENETAIFIAFSSHLSGTYQTAVMMKESVASQYPNLNLTVIDSKSGSLGQGLIVQRAAEMVKKHKNLNEIIQVIKQLSNHIEHIFTVDSLEHLYRGGRISRTSAFVGGLLNIKPILHLDDGKLFPFEKIRGRKKLIKRLLEIVEERGSKIAQQTIGITHGNDEESALKLKELVKEKFGAKDFLIQPLGSAIGAHTGTGALALFFLNKVEE